MSGELDRLRDDGRADAARGIAQYKQQEAEARARGDTATAETYRDNWQKLEQIERALAQLDGPRMVQERVVKWTALTRAHRATGKPRPSLLEVAEQMGWSSEQPLRDYCRGLGIKQWHDVHAKVAAFRKDV